MELPTTLPRSVLTILIPGVVAVAPWLLLLVQYTPATLGIDKHPTIAHTLLFAFVVVVGSMCEGLGTILESRWDAQRKKDMDVFGDWYAYLASTETPVGHRYLSRLVTSMYFELSMLLAVPSFVIGAALLAALRFRDFLCPILISAFVGIVLSISYFRWQAHRTHEALCVTRQKLRELRSSMAAPVTAASPSD